MLGQGRIQDFKLGGAHLNFFGGISCEKSRFYAKKIIFFPILAPVDLSQEIMKPNII